MYLVFMAFTSVNFVFEFCRDFTFTFVFEIVGSLLFDLYLPMRFCRLFHLSSDLIQPEQAYYLQPVQPGRSRNATSICPMDFSFGGDHLWDCFSVSSNLLICSCMHYISPTTW